MSHFSFKRPRLAAAYCDSLAGKGIANARSGLFLAAPRRVGKSTFLTSELIPEAQERSWNSIYVDLWVNKNADPSDLIAEAIKAKIFTYESKIIKLAKTMKLDKINIMGTFVLDFTQSGFPANITLTDALRILYELGGKPIMLVIDEAQHALMTKNGLNAMFAIKSARDQINISNQNATLMLVFTGSNRDKLAHLVLKKDQPFFGSEITPFPLLDKDYTDAFTEWVNNSLNPDNHFTQESMWQAFKLIGHRPEILSQIAGRIAINGEASNFAELLTQDALIWHGRIWEEFENDFSRLTSLQQIILEALINKGNGWSPFAEDSMNHYKQMTRNPEISTATIQTAIESLREQGFIWQSGRGAYALEDESFGEWFKHRLM